MDFFKLQRSQPNTNDFHGRTQLHELWPGTHDRAAKIETTLDIVAIHGLNGNLLETWTQGERLWLRDFLPNDLPQARIFTYGYDAQLLFSRSVSRVDDFARDLLERLNQRRRQYEGHQRPIIFICHSLGGLVCKRAISLSYELGNRYESLSKSIYGVIFMGTPHKGSNIAAWSRFIRSLANLPLMGNLRTTLLKDLEPNSEMLRSISAEFLERGRSLKKIFSFYERQTIGRVLVVEKESAVLGFPNEICIPLDADHRSMCRYATDSSDAYTTVLGVLEDMVNESLGVGNILTMDQSLDFRRLITSSHFTKTLSNQPKPSKNTCSWILNHQDYQRWYNHNEYRKILWIRGPAGVGKTVLMSFLVNHLNALEPTGEMQDAVLQFFCDDKLGSRSTHSDLAQALLAQALAIDIDLIRLVDSELVEEVNYRRHLRLGEDPSKHELMARLFWNAIINIFQRRPGMRFWIVIDAVDMLDSNSRSAMLQHLDTIIDQDLGNRVRIVLSDRVSADVRHVNFGVFDHSLGGECSWQDIENFLSLTCHGFEMNHNMSPTQTAEIKEAIETIAEGNFLQAKLAWANFTGGICDWDPLTIDARLTKLKTINQDTTSFYCSLLARIPEDMHEYSRRAFAWVIGARRPLTLNELHYAIILDCSHDCWQEVQTTANNSLDLKEHFEERFAYLLTVNSTGHVELTHRTVKTLLLSDPGSYTHANEFILQRFRLDLIQIDTEIAQGCLILLCLTEASSRDVMETFDMVYKLLPSPGVNDLDRTEVDLVKAISHPKVLQACSTACREFLLSWQTMGLFSYAVYDWVLHCERVKSDKAIVKLMCRFLRLPHAGWCWKVVSLLKSFYQTPFDRVILDKLDSETLCRMQLSPIYLVLQIGDFWKVMKAIKDTGSDLNSYVATGWTPLMIAIVNERSDSVSNLLADRSICTTHTVPGSHGPTFLHLSCFSTEQILWTLLCDSRFRDDINVPGEAFDTPLHKMLKFGINYTISNTSEKGSIDPCLYALALPKLDLTRRNRDGQTYLDLCFSHERGEDLVLALLKRPDFGIENLRNEPIQRSASNYGGMKNDRSYAVLAGGRDWQRLERVIFEEDPEQILHSSKECMNLLELYAYWGMKERLAIILEKVPRTLYVKHGPKNSLLLRLCAQQDWEDLGNIVVNKFGLNVMECDDKGRNALYYASFFGWRSMDKFVRGRSLTELNHKSNDGLTALMVAVEIQNMNAVKALRRAGAGILIRDSRGRTALHVAAEHGNFAIYQELLDDSVRDYGCDKQGASLLHYLAMWARKEMVLDHIKIYPQDVRTLDCKGRTPLVYAVKHANVGAVEALLEGRVLPRQEDSSGCTVMHYAISEGLHELIAVLMEKGMQIDKLDHFKRTALHLAVNSNSFDTFMYIIDLIVAQQQQRPVLSMAEPNLGLMLYSRDRFGQTVVHRACFLEDGYYGQCADDQSFTDSQDLAMEEQSVYDPFDTVNICISILHKLGANINEKDQFSVTPLHIAVKNNHRQTVRALLNCPGILVNQRDNMGRTPLDWSVAQNQVRITSLLEDFGAVHSRNFRTEPGVFERPEAQRPHRSNALVLTTKDNEWEKSRRELGDLEHNRRPRRRPKRIRDCELYSSGDENADVRSKVQKRDLCYR